MRRIANVAIYRLCLRVGVATVGARICRLLPARAIQRTNKALCLIIAGSPQLAIGKTCAIAPDIPARLPRRRVVAVAVAWCVLRSFSKIHKTSHSLVHTEHT
jgi:hypothetical protein